ncbi:uroporphyrinogen decarboxylase family protein [Desulfosporosinus hippei]|uniref:Uroporphyrinogen decarboxylase n=1 Tax=Desulfosporosinus hippei DSM 8344 TaxID=1121419 RepID=A0A1G8K023_9FIRM|nr:uroporphyrinogen decarboxylase family protein [Desulfosporosinus hippei]SDI36794.1 uroporphyrinogen decarboxylase [Desulfosporosinus hippei DSM 8344]
MSKIDRILAATRFEKVDRIPKGEFYLEDGLIIELLGLKNRVTFNDRIEACERCKLDALAFSPSLSLNAENRVWEGIEQWRKETDFFIFAIIDGPFQGAAKRFTSFTDYLLAIAKGDSMIPELVSKAIAANVELGLQALASGANGIIIADDIAYQNGTFISPSALRKYFFPGLAEQVNVLRREKVPVFFHADGNLLSVLTDIINCGVDGLHSLDFSSLSDIEKVRMATANKLCLMGGYDLGWFEAENRAEKALQLLEVTSSGKLGKGHIFGSSAGILGSTLKANQVLDVYQYVDNLPVKELGSKY